jgi:hypothetical protein
MRAGGLGLLLAGLVGTSGCLGFLHPVEAIPHAEAAPECRQLPESCRDHVYIFLMNGLDPVNYGNLTGLRDYIKEQGFGKVYYGQLYHSRRFTGEIRKIAHEDPQAHFVLVGFSLGSNAVHEIAQAVKPEGIHIDLLVFLSSNHPLMIMSQQPPANVGRAVNILTDGVMGWMGELAYAKNVHLTHTLHFGSPTHPTTLHTLAGELRAVAVRVALEQPPEIPAPGTAWTWPADMSTQTIAGQ